MSQYVSMDYANYAFVGGGNGDYSDNNNMQYLLYFIIFAVAVYVLYKFFINYNTLVDKVDKINNQPVNIVQAETTSRQRKNISINIDQRGNQQLINPVREYDYRALYDPLVAPRRRDDYDLPWVPYPTRGYPAPFHKMGLLIDKRANDNDRYKILILMGRQTYRGSRVFEYYATENNQSGIKFDVNSRRKNELQTDDLVSVNGLNRRYVVTLDRQLGYSYDPYLT